MALFTSTPRLNRQPWARFHALVSANVRLYSLQIRLQPSPSTGSSNVKLPAKNRTASDRFDRDAIIVVCNIVTADLATTPTSVALLPLVRVGWLAFWFRRRIFVEDCQSLFTTWFQLGTFHRTADCPNLYPRSRMLGDCVQNSIGEITDSPTVRSIRWRDSTQTPTG